MNAAAPSIGRIVDEGVLIALSAVRMAVKNHIIVAALREHSDYDRAACAEIAQRELLVLAAQNEEGAARDAALSKGMAIPWWRQDFTEDQRLEINQLDRRRRVYKRLASALRAVAEDEERVSALVDSAQNDASEEIGKALKARLIAQSVDGGEPGYADRRAERIRELLRVDLAALESERTAARFRQS